MGKETEKEKVKDGASSDSTASPRKSNSSRASSASQISIDDDLGLPTCRVCQCVESDKAGDAALGFLGIFTPLKDEPNPAPEQLEPDSKTSLEDIEGSASTETNKKLEPGYVKFVSPNGEVFICSTDLEMGACHNRDALIELGCSCKNDLGLVHYACALKWFVNHGSTVCEICGCAATNISAADYKKVLASLKEYEALRDGTANEAPNPAQVHDNSNVDPDAIAAIRRLRLSEIYLWFNPYNHHHHHHNGDGENESGASLIVVEQPSNLVIEAAIPPEHPATKWAVEGTGILLATGLLTVILAWLIAPRVGMKTAKNGLHILLGGVCALAVVVVFRIFVLTRIKYGPARYWAILFVFWFLVFGIWASRTHSAHPT
ncbi:hypothetical protein vseg_021508 [Gypsophila vaccaria]